MQFTSHKFTEVLEAHKIAISMDGKGRALDNVFIERFWRSLKQEKIYRIDLETVKEAKQAIEEYILFYNTLRPHQSLDYKTPYEVYSFSKDQVAHWNSIKEKKKQKKKKEEKKKESNKMIFNWYNPLLNIQENGNNLTTGFYL